MKRLLAAILLLLCATAQAAIFQNAFTTNQNTMGTAALVTQGNNLLGVNNSDTNTFLRSGGTGAAPYFSLLPGLNSTNVVNNFYASNVTTIQTNTFNVGKGGHLFITNITVLTNGTLTLQNIPLPAVLVALTNGVVTNAILSGITQSADGQTLTAASSGLSTDVTTLAYSTTNITGFDASTNGMSYYLLLTNHCLFGSSTFANLPAKTAYKTFTLCLQQNSTGTWAPKFTNTVVAWADGVQPIIKTNAGAVSYIYFHTSLATNSMLVGTPNINIQ